MDHAQAFAADGTRLAQRIKALKPAPVMLDAEAEDNNRWARRRPADLPGYVLADSLSNAIRCTLKDTSSSGALIELQGAGGDTIALPDRFLLVLMHYRERTEVECRVVRRRGNLIGVRYESHFRALRQPTRPVRSAAAKQR